MSTKRVNESGAVGESEPSVLDAVDPGFAPAPSEVAACVADEHPVLAGRVLCQFERPSGVVQKWLPCLMGMRPRTGDRVLVQRAENFGESIVTGVIDGFRNRIPPEPRAEHARRLRADETVRIEADDGTPLLEVAAGENGPVVRLLSKDVTIESPGTLRLEADAIELRARQGEVRVSASEDVVVTGEQIHLN